MTMPPDPVGDRLSRMAPLAIPEDYVPGVIHWLDILAGHAAIIDAVALPDGIEPAPVFRA